VSYGQASEDLKVPPPQLRNWVKGFCGRSSACIPGPGQMKPEQLEIARLKREVLKLKAERNILKNCRVPTPACAREKQRRYPGGGLDGRCDVVRQTFRFERQAVVEGRDGFSGESAERRVAVDDQPAGEGGRAAGVGIGPGARDRKSVVIASRRTKPTSAYRGRSDRQPCRH
jgi:transposase